VKGLDLAELYYRGPGAAMIRERFAGEETQIAAGLAGPGSECFGFDDEYSRDHDWGPAFCLWLTDEDHARIGCDLQRAYQGLPSVFQDFGPREASLGEEWRVGVSRISEFYRRFTGLSRPPGTLEEWMRIPEENLATCTNGRVFADPLGKFTAWRDALLAFYPEDVRLKKISSLCLTIAQTGQYNYLRSVRRADSFAATYCVAKFVADAIRLVFLLNRRYAPFYKWLHRAVGDLTVLGSAVHERVGALFRVAVVEEKADIMEEISVLLADELRRQGISDSRSDFLLDHAARVQSNISEARLRMLLSVE